MTTTKIRGNASFTCSHCGKDHFLENDAFNFTVDTRAETELDEEVRYNAKLSINCASCAKAIAISFDSWERPAGVVNYAYFGEQGASKISCEFHIEYHHEETDDDDCSGETETEAEAEESDDDEALEDEAKVFNEDADDDKLGGDNYGLGYSHEVDGVDD